MNISETIKQLAEYNAKLRREVELLTGQTQLILDQANRIFRMKDEAINALINEREQLKALVLKQSEESAKLREIIKDYEIKEIKRSYGG